MYIVKELQFYNTVYFKIHQDKRKQMRTEYNKKLENKTVYMNIAVVGKRNALKVPF